MMKPGVHVPGAQFFFEYEAMLRKNLDRPPSRAELACSMCLKERSVEAIKLRFGKDGIIKNKLLDVADKMGISIERVRQLIGLGLRRVKHIQQKSQNANQMRKDTKSLR